MNKREEQKQLANTQVVEVINNTAGISFIEFKDTDKLRPKLAPLLQRTIIPWVELSSTSSYDETEVGKWLIASLKSEAVHGKVVMMWDDYDGLGTPDRVEVVLSEDYEWAIPLWKRGHGLSIYSFERGYAWNATIFEDRYGFFRIDLKKYGRNNVKPSE